MQAAEEEEKQEAERKQQEEEREYREQGWRIEESLEEFQRCQQREEKWREVDAEDWGPDTGMWWKGYRDRRVLIF